MIKRKRRIRVITVKTYTMSEQIQIPKQRSASRRREEKDVPVYPTPQETGAQEHHKEVVDSVEAVLDDIDAVLRLQALGELAMVA